MIKEILSPPAVLQGRARKIYEEVAPQLKMDGKLTTATLPLIAAFCEASANWEWHTARAHEAGMLTGHGEGTSHEQSHPSVGQAVKQAELLIKLSNSLGISTRVRGPVKGQEEEADDFAFMLNTRNRRAGRMPVKARDGN